MLAGTALAVAALACGEAPTEPPAVTETTNAPSPAAALTTTTATPTTVTAAPTTEAPPRLPPVDLRASGLIGRVTSTPTPSAVITAPPDFAPPTSSPGANSTAASVQADLERALEFLQAGNLEEARKLFEAAAEAAPEDPRPLMGIALAAQFAGDLDGALAAANRAVELELDFLPALITRADIHLLLGDAGAAAEDFTAALRIEPLNHAAHFGHGQALAAQDDIEGAVAALTRAIDISGNNARYLIVRAGLYLALDDGAAAAEDYSAALRIDPLDSAAHFGYGLALATQGDLEGAVAALTRAIDISGNNTRYLIRRAGLYLALDDGVAAAEDYSAALRIDPLDSAAHFGYGLALATQGDLKGAVESVTRAIEISGTNGDYLIERARLHLALANVEAAIQDLEQAIDASPNDPRPALVLALTFQAQGDLGRAHEEATRAVEIAPDFVPALVTRGKLRLALGDAKGAAEDYDEAVRIDPVNPLAHAAQAQVREALGDIDGAIEALTRALDIAGEEPDYLADRALLHLDLGNIERALADLNRAFEAAPDRAGIRLLYADLLRIVDRYDDALEVIDALIDDEPGLPVAYRLRAAIRLSRDDEPGALADLMAAIAIDPEDAAAYATRALVHHQAERFDEAIADYDRSLELRPGDASTLNNRADARMLLGDLDLALEDIDAAVAANPELGIAHYTRGQILDELGRADEAQAAYDEAARLGYEPPEDVG